MLLQVWKPERLCFVKTSSSLAVFTVKVLGTCIYLASQFQINWEIFTFYITVPFITDC